MLEIECIIHNVPHFKCSCCRKSLFRADEENAHEWMFCPYCGEPIYEKLYVTSKDLKDAHF